MPFGCEPASDGSTQFRLWAPSATSVSLEYRQPDADWQLRAMQESGDGWFERRVEDCRPGSHYRFVMADGARVPDPASRYQPSGVHAFSEVVDPSAFIWQDADWRGRPWEQVVVYELHLGCFSPEGGYRGLQQRLDHLVELGITAIELMPLSQTPGERNWGYDGVYPYAPHSAYGRPEALKELVQEAHRRGLMVFLDVVYNHFGPEGNYLHAYAHDFFTERHQTPWGPAINLDGPGSSTVRDFFIHNALYWLQEFHLDGLRLDAVHALYDDSEPDFLEELAARVRDHVGPDRHVHLVLENDNNAAHYLRPASARGARYDAQWNDDIHHAIHTLLTGECAGYYADYADRPVYHLARCLTQGFAYQGEYSAYRGAARGESSATLPPSAFVAFMQNHDQIGNRAFGERLCSLTCDQALEALASILLLGTAPPLLFMGEEWASRRPFLYFCDFEEELAAAVRDGRRREYEHFPEFRDGDSSRRIPDPNAVETFASSCLDWRELAEPRHLEWLAFYQQLLAIRRDRVTPLLPLLHAGRVECDAVGEYLAVRWLAPGIVLTLIANLTDSATAIPLQELPGDLLFHTCPLRRQGSQHAAPAWHASWYLDCSGAAT